MKRDPVFIFSNSTLVDLETGILVPVLVLGIYWFVAVGGVFQVVESIATVSVSLAVLTFWLTTNHPAQGDQF